MIPDRELAENGVLIVTGSTLRAERADRPLAYKLKVAVEEYLEKQGRPRCVVVLSDIWYLFPLVAKLCNHRAYLRSEEMQLAPAPVAATSTSSV